jgi:hypothetical protein
VGAARMLLAKAGIEADAVEGAADPGLVITATSKEGIAPFIAALSRHRHSQRDQDVPRV